MPRPLVGLLNTDSACGAGCNGSIRRVYLSFQAVRLPGSLEDALLKSSGTPTLPPGSGHVGDDIGRDGAGETAARRAACTSERPAEPQVFKTHSLLLFRTPGCECVVRASRRSKPSEPGCSNGSIVHRMRQYHSGWRGRCQETARARRTGRKAGTRSRPRSPRSRQRPAACRRSATRRRWPQWTRTPCATAQGQCDLEKSPKGTA